MTARAIVSVVDVAKAVEDSGDYWIEASDAGRDDWTGFSLLEIRGEYDRLILFLTDYLAMSVGEADLTIEED